MTPNMNANEMRPNGNIACLIHDPNLRSAVVRTLEDGGYRVVVLSSTASANRGGSSAGDAALVDRVNDIATVRARLGGPVVVIGHTDSCSLAENAIFWGADDYLTVPLSTDRLAARIDGGPAHPVAARRAGRSTTPAEVMTFEDLVFYERERIVRRGRRFSKLTAHESRLLSFLMSRPYACHRTNDLRAALWHGTEIKTGTVHTFVCLLRRKLNAGGEVDLIETVHGLGYRFRNVEYPASAS